MSVPPVPFAQIKHKAILREQIPVMVDKPGARGEDVTLALLFLNPSTFIQSRVFELLYVQLTASMLNLYIPRKSSHPL